MPTNHTHSDEVISSRWPEYFSIADKSLAICHSYRPQFHIHPDHPQKVYAVALFAKLLKDAEAALLLLRHGMASQARALLRVGIECEITLAKCCNDQEFYKAYLVAAEQERLRLLKGIRRIQSGEFDDVKEVISEENVMNLAETLRGAPEKKLDQWASFVGLDSLYQTGYRLYSEDVHSVARCLPQFLKYDESGFFSEANWSPDEFDVRAELTEVSRVALNGLGLIGSLFELSPDEPFKQHQAEHTRLEELAANDDAQQKISEQRTAE
jgi:hypothetical protein